MPVAISRGKVLGDIAYEIARLEKLVADLKKLSTGEFPTAEELAEAPFLDLYVRSQRPMLCLIGICNDHPRLRGPVVATTDLWVVAEDLGWCRTLGRFYRLGSPRDGGDMS